MADINSINQNQWEPIPKESKDKEIISRPSMTYWQVAWRRLKKNYLAMLGLLFIVTMTLVAVLGPYVIEHDDSKRYIHRSLP